MDRIVFTFGTLYEDDIIEALLGRLPRHFYAELPGYSIYRASFSELPDKTKRFILSKGYNRQTFSFLFLKTDRSPAAQVSGRAYYLEPDDETVLDRWESYPDWYNKISTTIHDENGKTYKAFIYSGDFEGDKLQAYTRVVNNREKVLSNARAARREVLARIRD